MSKVAGLGPIVGYGPTEIHHLYGCTCQVKSVGNIGHWAIICLTKEHHMILDNKGKREFEKVTGHTEKELFVKTCSRMEDLPFSVEVYNEILRYHK